MALVAVPPRDLGLTCCAAAAPGLDEPAVHDAEEADASEHAFLGPILVPGLKGGMLPKFLGRFVGSRRKPRSPKVGRQCRARDEDEVGPVGP